MIPVDISLQPVLHFADPPPVLVPLPGQPLLDLPLLEELPDLPVTSLHPLLYLGLHNNLISNIIMCSNLNLMNNEGILM